MLPEFDEVFGFGFVPLKLAPAPEFTSALLPCSGFDELSDAVVSVSGCVNVAFESSANVELFSSLFVMAESVLPAEKSVFHCSLL